MTVFDLAIIGSGSGNSIPDERFDSWKIAIFESKHYGGTCLNVGCIPTKMFVYASDVAQNIQDSERYGITAQLQSVDWKAIVERVFHRIDPISAGGKKYRESDCQNIDVYTSPVHFVGRDKDGNYLLTTEKGDEVTAKKVVIAAGARPTIPDVVAESGAPYSTNEDIMRVADFPQRLIILGGGFIAAEFAHVFSSLGSQITVVTHGPALLRAQDHDISQRFNESAQAHWDVRLNAKVASVEHTDSEVTLVLTDGERITGDRLLVATGRRPNGDTLQLESVGIELRSDGRIKVDEHGRTSATNIWALGDVSSPYQLKHVANHEGRVVQANLLKSWESSDLLSFDHRFVPAAVFTHPQIASVGLTENEARAQGIDVAVKLQEFGDVAYGWAMEDSVGLCKLIAERGSGRLVGAHLIGHQASTLIQPLIQALSLGVDVKTMARGQYWIHPALTEVIENALLGLDV